MNIVMLAPKLIPYIEAIRAKHFPKAKPFEITGIRFDDNAMDDKFDDLLIFSNQATAIISYATTVPGKFWVQNPMGGNDGAAFIVPGPYEDSHVLGIHLKSKPDIAHEAWVQCGKIKYARDVDKDGMIDAWEPEKNEYGNGLNIHRANKYGITPNVNKWSAGCQVSQIAAAHEAAIEMHKGSMDVKTPISYLLTEAKDWFEFLGTEEVKKFILGLVE
jgi:hypothetical protein